jgi:hypothetical protein
MRRIQVFLMALLAGASVALIAVNARAQDYCIEPGPPFVTSKYVGVGFKVPPPGKCVNWSGFCMGCSPDNVQTGTACTASSGSHVSFVITTAYLANNRQWDFVRLNLPSQTGRGNSNNLQTGIGSTTSYAKATGFGCAPPPVP